jgi:ParB family transcriptional regulator, chromosome partitioning protein
LKGRVQVHMRIDEVRVVGRHRKNLGDIGALAKSISEIGMINPITVTKDGVLIAGERRLAACRMLGWLLVPALVAEDLDTAVKRLQAERDENTERKPMTPEELVAVGEQLEELERPRAARRMAATQYGSVHVNGADATSTSGEKTPTERRVRETRNFVGGALGWSGTTYERAKSVVETARDQTAPPKIRDLARAALQEMNATGNIHGPFERLRQARSAEKTAVLKMPPLQRAAQQRKALTSAVQVLSGLAQGLTLIDPIHPMITKDEAAQWVGGLSDSRRVLESVIKRLRAHIQGE